ncbi:MAG: hypothetical protein QOH97_2498 [Actinoplanes sp.]|jgi:hypothetical protein|nr:hypothetical protein [Actinoplanes sp.]
MSIAGKVHPPIPVQDFEVTHHALAGLGEIPNRR